MDFKNTRVKPRSAEEHQLIQKILFKHGCKWGSDYDIKDSKVKNYGSDLISINDNLIMDNSGLFFNQDRKEVSPELILNLKNNEVKKMEIEKPKTQLEKTACERAKKDAIESAIEDKQRIYKAAMDRLVILKSEIDLKEELLMKCKDEYKDLAGKLEVTEKDEKSLF